MLSHGSGLARRFRFRRGLDGTSQILAADPDGDDRDD
jgi:hypothetical protein